MIPAATGRTVPARVEEGLTGRQQPPDHEQQVQGEDRAEHGRVRHPRGEPGRRLREHEDDPDRQQDEQGSGRRGELAPSVEELAEPGEHCREAGRGEAATVERSGIGPDPAGVHDGRWSSCDVGRATVARSG